MTRKLSKLDNETLQNELHDKLLRFSPDNNTAELIDTIEQRITLPLQPTLEKLAPLRSVTISPKRKPWVTPEILKAMKERDRTYKKAPQSHCPQEKEEHKRLRALVSNSLGTVKSRYLESRLTKGNSLSGTEMFTSLALDQWPPESLKGVFWDLSYLLFSSVICHEYLDTLRVDNTQTTPNHHFALSEINEAIARV